MGDNEFGTKLKDLKNKKPTLVERIKTHFNDTELPLDEMTPGEIQHHDVSYGQADPRVETANKHTGDRTASGGTGPKKI